MTTTTPSAVSSLHIERIIDVDAPIRTVFDAVLAELGPESTMPDGAPFPMSFEPWPGGRWFRDLGDGAGHLWGHVQVIKPPTLLEICGPLFMSYAATSHVQYRLTETARGVRITLVHRAIGQITPEHREGVVEGWGFALERIRQIAEGRAAPARNN